DPEGDLVVGGDVGALDGGGVVDRDRRRRPIVVLDRAEADAGRARRDLGVGGRLGQGHGERLVTLVEVVGHNVDGHRLVERQPRQERKGSGGSGEVVRLGGAGHGGVGHGYRGGGRPVERDGERERRRAGIQPNPQSTFGLGDAVDAEGRQRIVVGDRPGGRASSDGGVGGGDDHLEGLV